MIRKSFYAMTVMGLCAGFVSCESDTEDELTGPVVITVGLQDQKFDYSYEEQVVKIALQTTNRSYCALEVTPVEEGEDVSWLDDAILSDTLAPGIGLVFELPEYLGQSENRQANLTFSTEHAEDVTITLTQGKLVPEITVGRGEEGEFVYSGKASYSASIYVETNNNAVSVVSVAAVNEGDDISWVRVSEYNNTATSGEDFFFQLAENTDTENERYAYLVFNTEGAEEKRVKITQAAAEIPNTLEVSDAIHFEGGFYSFTRDHAASSTSITVTTDAEEGWSAAFSTYEEDSEWCQITPATGESGGAFDIVLTENTTGLARYGTVTVTAGNTEIQISITQEKQLQAITSVVIAGVENHGTIKLAGNDWANFNGQIDTEGGDPSELEIRIFDEDSQPVTDVNVIDALIKAGPPSGPPVKVVDVWVSPNQTGAKRTFFVEFYSMGGLVFDFAVEQDVK